MFSLSLISQMPVVSLLASSSQPLRAVFLFEWARHKVTDSRHLSAATYLFLLSYYSTVWITLACAAFHRIKSAWFVAQSVGQPIYLYVFAMHANPKKPKALALLSTFLPLFVSLAYSSRDARFCRQPNSAVLFEQLSIAYPASPFISEVPKSAERGNSCCCYACCSFK